MSTTPPSHTQETLRVDTGGPKLRSSCDSCGASKVRCDRSRPVCHRCDHLGLVCVYGLSRKAGKPPRKRPVANLDARLGKRICPSWTGPSRHPDTSSTPSGPLPDNLSDLAVEILPNSDGIYPVFDSTEQDQLLCGFYPSLPMDLWPQLDSLGGATELSSAPSTDPMNGLAETSKFYRAHSCPRESYEIFRDLICPSPSLHAPESNSVTVPAPLDLVLHTNRNAVNRLSRVLKCPCAKSGHRALVHASIVSRILIWYQQAAGWTSCSSWSRPPSISSPADPVASQTAGTLSSTSSQPPDETTLETMPNSQPSLVQATGFSIEHVPVAMGTFGIEDHNLQAAVRNQLVLSELKKAAKLIDMFASPDLGESTSGGVAELYSYLGVWLRSEHARTVKILMSRVGTFHEDLVS